MEYHCGHFVLVCHAMQRLIVDVQLQESHLHGRSTLESCYKSRGTRNLAPKRRHLWEVQAELINQWRDGSAWSTPGSSTLKLWQRILHSDATAWTDVPTLVHERRASPSCREIGDGSILCKGTYAIVRVCQRDFRFVTATHNRTESVAVTHLPPVGSACTPQL